MVNLSGDTKKNVIFSMGGKAYKHIRPMRFSKIYSYKLNW